MRAYKQFKHAYDRDQNSGIARAIGDAAADIRAHLVERGWFGMEAGRERQESTREAVYGTSRSQDGDLAAMGHRYAQADRDAEREAEWEAEL